MIYTYISPRVLCRTDPTCSRVLWLPNYFKNWVTASVACCPTCSGITIKTCISPLPIFRYISIAYSIWMHMITYYNILIWFNGLYLHINFIYIIPGSPWSWKFPHQSQNRSILPNSREKELLNGYFHSRTLFLTPERFRTVLNAFWTLFERFFPLQNISNSWTVISTPVLKFQLQTQNRSILGLVLKLQVSWFTR